MPISSQAHVLKQLHKPHSFNKSELLLQRSVPLTFMTVCSSEALCAGTSKVASGLTYTPPMRPTHIGRDEAGAFPSTVCENLYGTAIDY